MASEPGTDATTHKGTDSTTHSMADQSTDQETDRVAHSETNPSTDTSDDAGYALGTDSSTDLDPECGPYSVADHVADTITDQQMAHKETDGGTHWIADHCSIGHTVHVIDDGMADS